MNYIKTGFLLVALTMLFVWVGGYFGGQAGASLAFMMAIIMNVGAYWFSDKIVLAMYKAKEVEPSEVPELYNMVDELAIAARLPMPKIYIAPIDSPNAFATGRDPQHAAVCVTQGILNLLNKEELRGVLAHELAHIKNRDTLIMTVTATVAGAITMIASWARWAAIFGGVGGRSRDNRDGNIFGYLVMIILAPIAALLIQLAISRSREYAADKRGSYIAHSTEGLSRALLKLEKGVKTYPMKINNTTRHLFIVNPFSGDAISNLFSTHPSVQKRIEQLKGLKV
ncbi:MAG: zinc metalloprotease HtpX [Candidatus Omnitrophota bacterium]